LSLGADLTVRYAIDPLKVAALARSLPDNVAGEIVEPATQGVVYKVFARYAVREIFSTKRAEIQAAIETELKPRLAVDGIVLRNVQIGKIDLPAQYRRGMETLLAEELAGEKMKYTLELKEKQVRETELAAQADKVRRELAAEAAAREQVIAAKGQEEAMKHVLPFKQRQIEQRQLEAEAEKVSRIKAAEGSAQARRIEASGEAEARQKLADAEVYRMDKVGKSNAEQMGREGALITRHPLLIQKTMADKLSDKVQVIIAAPGTDGSFIGAGLLGNGNGKRNAMASAAADAEQHAAADDAREAP
jgi:regulator of protease activity HflC (stomatin/prohibitin superfamily)